VIKPRNPMGIHVHNRKAGKHKKTEKAKRQNEKVLLKKTINKGSDSWESVQSRIFSQLSRSLFKGELRATV